MRIKSGAKVGVAGKVLWTLAPEGRGSVLMSLHSSTLYRAGGYNVRYGHVLRFSRIAIVVSSVGNIGKTPLFRS